MLHHMERRSVVKLQASVGVPTSVKADMFGDSGSFQPLPQRCLEHLVLEIGKDLAFTAATWSIWQKVDQ
jgi:hypothetical protein